MINKNTCPAFYLDATIDPAGAYSPCTALGGGAFKFGNQSFNLTWQDPKLEEVRERSKNGEQLSMCNRCWSEEQLGLTSERNYLINDVPEGLDYTDKNYYMSGPRHLNIKVSNICNLRCRTCQSRDSYLYHIEGEHYERKNNLTHTPYTIEKFKKHFTDQQLNDLFDASGNLERIELYGGEPFLDDQIPRYLNRLIDADLSERIDLYVSTNATHALTDSWCRIFNNFNNIIINVSIDGIGDRFTYLRHPGIWSVAERNITKLFSLKNEKINIIPVVTVSALNVWNLPEVFEYFKSYDVEPFIILVQWPQYYCVNVYPDAVKTEISQHLSSYNNDKFRPVINLINTDPKNHQGHRGLSPWQEFKFWTQEKDLYRKENFLETFSDLGRVILQHTTW
jgi:radical SAM protein with 4Fe4S-binding SPASM domain